MRSATHTTAGSTVCKSASRTEFIVNSELEHLQGTWNIVDLEVEGQRMPSDGSQFVITGEGFATLGAGAVYEGRLVVDASRNPRSMDLHFTEGPEKGNVNPGIFELEGERWRLCLQMTGKVRPDSFATSPGTGLALETLERAKRGG
jgi:uncharacterized protein (TIGR03067 family)